MGQFRVIHPENTEKPGVVPLHRIVVDRVYDEVFGFLFVLLPRFVLICIKIIGFHIESLHPFVVAIL